MLLGGGRSGISNHFVNALLIWGWIYQPIGGCIYNMQIST